MRNAKTSQPRHTLQKFYPNRFILLLGVLLTLGFASNVRAADAGNDQRHGAGCFGGGAVKRRGGRANNRDRRSAFDFD